jgi:hypothetical protein
MYAKKIKAALAYSGKSEAWLARELKTTPSAFNQRMKTEKFTYDEMKAIATLLGADFKAEFEFPDGTKI